LAKAPQGIEEAYPARKRRWTGPGQKGVRPLFGVLSAPILIGLLLLLLRLVARLSRERKGAGREGLESGLPWLRLLSVGIARYRGHRVRVGVRWIILVRVVGIDRLLARLTCDGINVCLTRLASDRINVSRQTCNWINIRLSWKTCDGINPWLR
jgi:hypothetical protein